MQSQDKKNMISHMLYLCQGWANLQGFVGSVVHANFTDCGKLSWQSQEENGLNVNSQ